MRSSWSGTPTPPGGKSIDAIEEYEPIEEGEQELAQFADSIPERD